MLAVVRPQPSIFEEGAVSIAERALGEPTVHLFDHRVKSGILAVDKQRGERLTRSRNAKAPEERHGHAFPNHRLVEKHIVENECLQSQELTARAVMSEVDFQTRLDAAACSAAARPHTHVGHTDAIPCQIGRVVVVLEIRAPQLIPVARVNGDLQRMQNAVVKEWMRSGRPLTAARSRGTQAGRLRDYARKCMEV